MWRSSASVSCYTRPVRRPDVRPVQVTSGRHPFEVTFLAASLLCGVALLALDRRPPSVVAAMPTWVQSAWAVGLIVAGVVGLVGVAWRGDLATALAIELLGIAVLGTVTTMYAIALAVISGDTALVAGGFVAGVAVASWWRIGQIVRQLHVARQAVEAGAVEHVPLLVERET